MMLSLYDTMERRKRPFSPANHECITMYVCGPTVYNRAHIGNARPAVVFDVLARLLRALYGGGALVYARNVTDVDDKIIEAAEAAGVGYRKITEKYYRHYVTDMGALGVMPPDFEPRATAFVPRMVDMIKRLIVAGTAYEAQGHVLFHVPADPDYGALSRRDPEAIRSGARVEVAPYKRDPTDFVLWKPAGISDEEVALSFDSPWGKGRPGWHIECSAMIEALGETRGIGNTIDIHGGGLDLIFPHHENEIAQSRCAHGGTRLARYWVHNGFVSMGSEKMSKSLGNIVTVGDLLHKGHRGSHIRHALLSAHYRQPLVWTERVLGQSQRTVDRWRGKWERRYLHRPMVLPEEIVPPHRSVVDALCDDLNTPVALAALGKLADSEDWASFVASAELLGINFKEKPAEFAIAERRRIDGLVSTRADAKRRRDFSEADRIRSELAEEGIVLEDRPDGTTDWRRAKP